MPTSKVHVTGCLRRRCSCVPHDSLPGSANVVPCCWVRYGVLEDDNSSGARKNYNTRYRLVLQEP